MKNESNGICTECNEMGVCIVEVIVESAEELNIRSSRIDLNDNSSYVLLAWTFQDRE